MAPSSSDSKRDVPPALQVDLARNTISSCKVVVLKKIAQTVRQGGDHAAALKKLEKLKAELDEDFGLALHGDKAAIGRGLNRYAEFLTDYKEQQIKAQKSA